MSPVTHGLLSWLIANARSDTSPRERLLITLGGLSPDLDGLGMVAQVATKHWDEPLNWFHKYHHELCHNLLFGLLVAGVCAALSEADRRLRVGALVFLTFHLHLLCDVIGSKGPDGSQWPIPYFTPFSNWQWTWQYQWRLDSWPNILITAIALALTFAIAWRRGHSPLEFFSNRVNDGFVAALRNRVPLPESTPENTGGDDALPEPPKPDAD